jgi:type I restriction enzyme S subunit
MNVITKKEITKYVEYKDSGEGWLGEVPKEWEVVRLKHIFKEKKITHNAKLHCGSISFGVVVYKDDDKVPLSTKASYQEVLEGEYLINPLNLNYDLKSLRIALSKLNVVVSSGYIVIKNHVKIDKSYYKWLLHRYDVAYMKLLGSGVRQTINFNNIANSLLPYPSFEEQSAIANFLDQKTVNIDKAIAQKEKLITLLKERKQILIQNAVTKGLDPNVKLEDTGVEWIGEIPEHWEVKKLKYVLSLKSEKILSKDSDLSYIGMENIESWTGKHISTISETDGLSNYFNEGCILFGKLRPYLAKVYLTKQKGICSTELLVYKTKNHDVRYFHKLMLSYAFVNLVDSSTYGSKMPRASAEWIGNQLIPIPLLKEQNEITTYIELQLKKIEESIGLNQQQIEKLKEYKTTLINSAVTGKIKVC